VKDARDPLRLSVAGCIVGSGTGAARAGSATSGQSPLRAITRAPKSCRQRPEPWEPLMGRNDMVWPVARPVEEVRRSCTVDL
jgi:hypothetical protein